MHGVADDKVPQTDKLDRDPGKKHARAWEDSRPNIRRAEDERRRMRRRIQIRSSCSVSPVSSQSQTPLAQSPTGCPGK